ncbi:helix-turn-helix domain-containing protein [Phytopseudomonas seleniipraecipitans]|uniref:Helix-turn-helix n=1 Tax=Phytopseudomonas seleniipraecipitans TaxID=640205 RepID=A0A1G7RP11_9GAMM|nr:helix-turn-helix transcriptional regulator [Pseudomonas seleniipraecipitans]SDG12506.1 Helix-turn-helix [Pseudomonas seleniipraecipitans]
MNPFVDIPLFHMSREHCIQARARLNWSIYQLAEQSGVSPLAIEQYESGFRKLKPISLQAIAYACEAKGMMFIPGHKVMFGDNVRGACPDPRLSPDYHEIE